MTDAIGVHTPSDEEEVEYAVRYKEAVKQEARVPIQTEMGQDIIWAPQDGSQNDFMACTVFECLVHGTRGGGKTDALLMSYAQYVDRGFGSAWRGIIFRETYPQLADVQAKSEKWFRQIFGSRTKFNKSKMQWEWDTGEMLMFRHMRLPTDALALLGHEYPFIGWEELCNWADDSCYTQMFACCRSSTPGLPRMIRATTNPYGVGHNWVKERFRLYGQWWKSVYIDDATDPEGREYPPRCSIYSYLDENLILLKEDPNYKQTIIASANNPAMAEAWLHGSWDIVAGGMFDDVWVPAHNIVPSFDVPNGWRIDRSFDWGSSAPFSVGWWAESNGSDLKFNDGKVCSTVRGDLFRIREWYGWSGRPNQGLRMLAVDVAKGIVERELMWGLRTVKGTRVNAGPADNAIHKVENGMSIAHDMAKPVRVGNLMYSGVAWTRADKSDGSVESGLEHMRKMIRYAHPNEGRPRERAGIFVCEECDQFMRTVPNLPRDEKKMDRVDDNAEDHVCDETRYRVRFSGQYAKSGRHVGMY